MDFKETIDGMEIDLKGINIVFESYEKVGSLVETRKMFFHCGACYFFAKTANSTDHKYEVVKTSLIQFHQKIGIGGIAKAMFRACLAGFGLNLPENCESEI